MDTMDKTEKLALARKKLRKFQAKSATNHIGALPTDHQSDAPSSKQPKVDETKMATINNNAESQTIDILVSEKTNLHHQLTNYEMQLQTKQIELNKSQEEVKSLRIEMEKIQRENEKLIVSLTEKTQLLTNDTTLKQLLQENQINIEELNQEKSELLSKISQQANELSKFQQTKIELEKKLNMYEVLTQQLQSSQPSTPNEDTNYKKKNEILEEQIATLSATVQSLKREKEQCLSDIGALRDTMIQNKQESARKIGELQTQLKESELEMSALQQHIQKQDIIYQNKLQDQNNEIKDLKASETQINSLQQQIQQLTVNNLQLSEMQAQSDDKIAKLEEKLKQAKDEKIDQQNLLSTISNDKETLSRAVSQNKELKKNIRELEEAFVYRTNQNAELTSSLETEQRKKEKLERKLEELENSLLLEQQRVAELMDKMENKSNENINYNELSIECNNLKEERDKLLSELQHLSKPTPPPMEHTSSPLVEHTSSPLVEHTSFPLVEHTSSPPMEHTSSDDDNIPYSVLQQSFTALQEHFVHVMQDKAELEDKLQKSEHQIIQLEGESETIGEYITLYQTQRDALKIKFIEKDKLIQQLLEDKRQLELRLMEVQGLVKQLEAPPPTHDLSLPTHLQGSHGNNIVVDQIVSRIEQLTTTPLDSALMQCPCCSGNLLVI